MGPQMSQPAVLQTDSKRWEFYKDVNTKKLSCFLVTYHMLDGCFIHIPTLQKNDRSHLPTLGDEATEAQRS